MNISIVDLKGIEFSDVMSEELVELQEVTMISIETGTMWVGFTNERRRGEKKH